MKYTFYQLSLSISKKLEPICMKVCANVPKLNSKFIYNSTVPIYNICTRTQISLPWRGNGSSQKVSHKFVTGRSPEPILTSNVIYRTFMSKPWRLNSDFGFVAPGEAGVNFITTIKEPNNCRIVSWNTLADRYIHYHRTERPYADRRIFSKKISSRSSPAVVSVFCGY